MKWDEAHDKVFEAKCAWWKYFDPPRCGKRHQRSCRNCVFPVDSVEILSEYLEFLGRDTTEYHASLSRRFRFDDGPRTTKFHAALVRSADGSWRYCAITTNEAWRGDALGQ